MSSSGGASRVSIQDDMRKTIQNIWEITGKQHTDEDVYAMFQECAMDPDETIQKLLCLDTFHEVKSRRDKRKEGSIRKVPDSKLTSETQGRGARGNRNPPSTHASSGGVRNIPSQRDKRTNNFIERGSGPAPLPQQKTKDNAGPLVIKASVAVANGPSELSKGISTHAPTPEYVDVDFVKVSENSASRVSSALDPVIAPPLMRQSGPGPVKRETGHKRMPSANSVYKKKVLNKLEAVEQDQVPQPLQPSSMSSEDHSLTTNLSPERVDAPVEEAPVSLEVITSKVASVSVEAGSQSLLTSTVFDSQHVTFPNHFQVSEAIKNGLTFGSFDASFGARTDDPVGNDKSNFIGGSPQESIENLEESSPRSHHILDIVDHPQPSSLGHEEVLPSSEEKGLGNLEITNQEPKQDTLLPPEVPTNPVIQDGPSNSFGFISPILANPNVVHSDGSEPQARDVSRPSYFANGNGLALSSPSPTPTPAAQSSLSVPPQPIPVFRQPYPLNYFPYGHYLPIYMPPIHQLLSHNAFAQHPSAGNLYIPPTMAAPGVKLPFPMFKPGTNTATPIGIPSGYGGYGSTSMGYTASPTATSGSSASNEDLAASQLKENHIYSTGQLQSEGSTVWVPPLGQDLTSLQVNSLYNLPQGQHVTFSPAQAGHGAFGIQHPAQAMAGAPTAHPLLQQSQGGGTVETVGLPSGAYQLPQHAQVNWNTNF